MANSEVKLESGRDIPHHVAIIMDGNGRWAAQRGLPRGEGHRRGVEAVRNTVRVATELGIGILTIFSFSSENWSRPRSEILDLMALLRRFIRNDLADLHRNNVRVRVIGERRLAEDVEAGRLRPEAINEDLLASRLDTSDLPDPDLVIRTSGEQRLSNFLLWQAAYSELVFVPVFWPDFDRATLEGAIAEYRTRERRFGGLAARNAS
jgi:undecaprenyl diphosphate synthase